MDTIQTMHPILVCVSALYCVSWLMAKLFPLWHRCRSWWNEESFSRECLSLIQLRIFITPRAASRPEGAQGSADLFNKSAFFVRTTTYKPSFLGHQHWKEKPALISSNPYFVQQIIHGLRALNELVLMIQKYIPKFWFLASFEIVWNVINWVLFGTSCKK